MFTGGMNQQRSGAVATPPLLPGGVFNNRSVEQVPVYWFEPPCARGPCDPPNLCYNLILLPTSDVPNKFANWTGIPPTSQIVVQGTDSKGSKQWFLIPYTLNGKFIPTEAHSCLRQQYPTQLSKPSVNLKMCECISFMIENCNSIISSLSQPHLDRVKKNFSTNNLTFLSGKSRVTQFYPKYSSLKSFSTIADYFLPTGCDLFPELGQVNMQGLEEFRKRVEMHYQKVFDLENKLHAPGAYVPQWTQDLCTQGSTIWNALHCITILTTWLTLFKKEPSLFDFGEQLQTETITRINVTLALIQEVDNALQQAADSHKAAEEANAERLRRIITTFSTTTGITPRITGDH
ncbi:hypothetical protein Pelo_2843 [Pelomyxa schiedti]|nr:hypothetical protein Pelo_2843 [Pelomyxa schiedti]